MTGTNETIADILREMRDERIIRLDDADVTRCLLRNLADRIEAAAERERGTCKNCAYYTRKDCPVDEPAGNAAAMREALERIVEWADRYYGRLCFYGGSPEGDGWRTASRAANDALAQARAALSAPPRNCDVGTAEEQGERLLRNFTKWRDGHTGKKIIAAIMEWAQEPYGIEVPCPAEGGDHA